MGIRRMVVVVVIMGVVMIMVVMMVIARFEAAKTRAERITKRAVFDVRAGCACALTFDMVMVAFLNCTDFRFKTKDLGAVLAHGAIGWRDLSDLFGDAFSEGPQHIRMIT